MHISLNPSVEQKFWFVVVVTYIYYTTQRSHTQGVRDDRYMGKKGRQLEENDNV
jgi:hypothetical protein